jgi:putative acetyltransferase
MISIKPEEPSDTSAVYRVHEAAFGRKGEAELVTILRREVPQAISLVAERQGEIIGHILFTPVTFEPDRGVSAAGLAPLAVLSEDQGKGIGTRLVREGLRRCEAQGYNSVVILGHPEYYSRFGFVPAYLKGLSCEFRAPPEAFMVLMFSSMPEDRQALVKYHPAFYCVS